MRKFTQRQTGPGWQPWLPDNLLISLSHIHCPKEIQCEPHVEFFFFFLALQVAYCSSLARVQTRSSSFAQATAVTMRIFNLPGHQGTPHMWNFNVFRFYIEKEVKLILMIYVN